MGSGHVVRLETPELVALSTKVEEAARSTKEGVRYFIEPGQGTLRRATRKRHHIIFGRRGSGKSSLLLKAGADLTVDRRSIAYITRSSKHVLGVLLCGVATLRAFGPLPSQGNAPSPDDVQIVAVSPAEGTQLREGQRVRFEVAIHYALQSAESAILQVYAERYATSGGVCENADLHQTEGGTTVRLKRGTGDVKVRFSWQEGTGPEAKVPRSAASLAFGMNLWTDKHGRPVKPVLRPFAKSFCRPVAP